MCQTEMFQYHYTISETLEFEKCKHGYNLRRQMRNKNKISCIPVLQILMQTVLILVMKCAR